MSQAPPPREWQCIEMDADWEIQTQRGYANLIDTGRGNISVWRDGTARNGAEEMSISQSYFRNDQCHSLFAEC